MTVTLEKINQLRLSLRSAHTRAHRLLSVEPSAYLKAPHSLDLEVVLFAKALAGEARNSVDRACVLSSLEFCLHKPVERHVCVTAPSEEPISAAFIAGYALASHLCKYALDSVELAEACLEGKRNIDGSIRQA